MKRLFSVLFLLFLFSVSYAQLKYKYPFQDPSLSVDTRVTDLIQRMTLSEKLSQLFSHAAAVDRLGIPAYDWWNEALHGVARAGKATVFPQAIGMAASFNQPLLFEVATAISDEARAKHNYFIQHHVRSIYTGLTFWSPNINIFRDPRWGRGQETYGEDPYLTGRMAVNFIRGLQGDNPKYFKTIATAKHYAVHSGPEFSRHTDDVFVNNKDLYNTYLPAFKAAVREANVQSVMCAYNRFRNQPCCGSNLLLSNILRSQFGFKGYVVSDCGAISDFYNVSAHHVVETAQQALGWSLSSGTDINCEEKKAFLPDNVDSAVRAGIINEKDIDISLHRLFKARFQLGMFDSSDSVIYNKIPFEVVGNEAHLKLALKMAEQSLVLLKNNGILPLKHVTRIALIGPNADNMQILLGNYNGNPIHPATPLAALQKRLGSDHIFYSAGSPIVDRVYTNFSTIGSNQLFHIENGKQIKGLKGEYFSNTKFMGPAVLTKTDSMIHFNWLQSPLNNQIEDSFSVRWSGILIPRVSGSYIFGGNLRVKIDGKPTGSAATKLTTEIQYQLEAELVVEPFWWGNTVEPAAELTWVNTLADYRQQALDVADKSDVIVFCGGISSQLEGEEMPLETAGFSHGDRTDLKLPSAQEDLLKGLKKTGKKIVYINFSGSAVALNWEDANVDAIIQAFYPGEGGGEAIVNALFGTSNSFGRLPVTFYKSVDDLPAFKDYNMKGRTYRYFEGKPLYSFGYGLSYTRFDYENLKVPDSIACGQPFNIDVNVKNSGDEDGEEVVEIYTKRRDRETDDPRLSLSGFSRVYLKKGESRKVTIRLSPEQFSTLDNLFNRISAPGLIDIYAGGHLPETDNIEQKNIMHAVVQLAGPAVRLP